MASVVRVPSRILGVAVVLAAVVAAAAVLTAGHSLAQGEIALSHSDVGREISLTEDQVLVIALDANPSTGFQWEAVALDSAILIESDLDAPAYGAAEVPGATVQQRLRFRPVAAGRTVLNLANRRPWQRDVAPAATFSVTVVGSGPFTGANIPTPTATPDPNVTPTLPAVPTSDVGGQVLPTHFNWCDQGDCTPIKDQAQCGSCWAFATAGVFELAIKIKDGLTKDLSEQYLVSCNTEGYGCGGGLWVHEYHENYAPPGEPAAGAVYESDFAYAAVDVACGAPHAHHERISAWANVPGGGYGEVPTTSAMKQAIHDHGPLAVGVCAGNAFISYSGGLFRTDEASDCPNGTNHGVILAGWDDATGVWYLRNSWGTGWGENGYMRIGYGVSTVGEDATYVVYGSSAPVSPTPTPTRRPGLVTEVYLPMIARQGSIAPVPAPTRTPAPTGLLNPGFELGARDWTEYSWQGWNLILHAADLDVPPHGGSWAAWLGGDDNEIAYVEQRVKVPASRPYLTYWHWIGSQDACGYDFGGVIVDRTTVMDVYDLCSATATGGWVRHSVNLSAYGDDTVYLQIRAETDSSSISNLFVDEVSFRVSAAAPDDAPGSEMVALTSKLARSNPRGAPAAGETRRLLGR